MKDEPQDCARVASLADSALQRSAQHNCTVIKTGNTGAVLRVTLIVCSRSHWELTQFSNIGPLGLPPGAVLLVTPINVLAREVIRVPLGKNWMVVRPIYACGV